MSPARTAARSSSGRRSASSPASTPVASACPSTAATRSRRSGSAKAMSGPGPSKSQIAQILQAGARAPDHGKLFPWRFIVFEDDGRNRAGDILADVIQAEGERANQVEEERGRFLRAPVVIGVR